MKYFSKTDAWTPARFWLYVRTSNPSVVTDLKERGFVEDKLPRPNKTYLIIE